MNKKLDYDDKRLLIWTLGVAIVSGALFFVLACFIIPTTQQIERRATIKVFNEHHEGILDSYEFNELSDEDKVNYIYGYKQGRKDEINAYNKMVQNKLDSANKLKYNIKGF